MDLSKLAEDGIQYFLHSLSNINPNHYLFIKYTPLSFIIILVYVDDVIIEGGIISKLRSIKDAFHNSFKIKDLS